jgi:hypothetical protein
MKNNTKIRLHLSKQLFESLTKQVIAEAKTKHYGAGMEEVKAKKEKAPKKDKVEETTEMVDENTLSDLMGKLKTLPADKLKQLKTYWDNELSPEAVKSGKAKTTTLPSNIGEMETKVSEKKNMHQLKEVDSTNAGMYDIGVWANELLQLDLKDENDLVSLGSKVLAAGTAGAFGVATGLIMYSDQIKAGIKKAGALLKKLAKGGGGVKEGTGTDPLRRLPTDALAALKK